MTPKFGEKAFHKNSEDFKDDCSDIGDDNGAFLKFIYKNEKEKSRFKDNYEKVLLVANKMEFA